LRIRDTVATGSGGVVNENNYQYAEKLRCEPQPRTTRVEANPKPRLSSPRRRGPIPPPVRRGEIRFAPTVVWAPAFAATSWDWRRRIPPALCLHECAGLSGEVTTPNPTLSSPRKRGPISPPVQCGEIRSAQTGVWIPACAQGRPGKLLPPTLHCRPRESGDPSRRPYNAEKSALPRPGCGSPLARGRQVWFRVSTPTQTPRRPKAAHKPPHSASFPGHPCACAGTTSLVSSLDTDADASKAESSPQVPA